MAEALIPNLPNIAKLKNDFSFPYQSKNGVRYNNCYNIAMNILLVIANLRPAFIILECDFDEKSMPIIKERVQQYLSIYDFSDKSSLVFNINNEDTITLLKQFVKINSLAIEDYETYNKTREILLGQLMGYPCAGDTDADASIKYRWKVTLVIVDYRGDTIIDIITNICIDKNKAEWSYVKFKGFKSFLKEAEFPVKLKVKFDMIDYRF